MSKSKDHRKRLIDTHVSIGIEKAVWQIGKGIDPLFEYNCLFTGESHCCTFKLFDVYLEADSLITTPSKQFNSAAIGFWSTLKLKNGLFPIYTKNW